MKLTKTMQSILRKIAASPNGIEADRVHYKTLAALEKARAVRVEFVSVTTPKGRNVGVVRMVFAH
jgi:hypothetical protein